MKNLLLRVKIILCIPMIFILTSCGGGGSSPNDQSWLSITPNQVDLTTYAGESMTFSIRAQSSKTFQKKINVAIIDKVGVVTTNVLINAISSTDYVAMMETSTVLPVGTHTSNLELRLCEDDPLVCKVPLQGSPWLIPVKVTVKPAMNLTPLAALPQAPNWSTYQGNSSHTGYIPATFDPANFSRRWIMQPFSQTSLIESVSHDNGRIFAVYGGYFQAAVLVAYSEQTAKELWRVDLGTWNRVNAPAAGNGKVYVTTTGQGGYFWVFDQESGNLLSKNHIQAQWPTYLAPTIQGDGVYTNSGHYGGLSKFSSMTSELLWGNFTLPQYDGWTPAVDEKYAYAYMSGELYAVRVEDGQTEYKINDPDNQWSGYTGAAPVLSGKQMAFVVNGGRLVAFDLATKTRAWSAKGTATGQPAYAKDVVYVLNASGSVLEAHAPSNGALLWTSESFDGSGGGFDQLIITDNLAFVSSSQKTIAIDLNTHKKVWEFALGGELSISDRGVLYICSSTGKFVAVNLR